ncbi:cytosolic carboxypeptidase-like protein 5 isoform X1 [Tubulanus polymorphus]|uniref:cytosolic carboxypeptidase-like protein 5 isoform X1 n=1 Tax=Tubulanus polymorphus TaxID=672921 RepID=UPI003DA5632E
MEFRSGGLLFTSKFDSGNLAKVEKVAKDEDDDLGSYGGCEPKPDYEYNVWTKPDCAGTQYENGNRSWFYFGIRGGNPGRLLKINIMNMNKQGKLYSQGHAPLVKTVPGKPKWERIRDRPTYEVVDNNFILTFTHRFADFKNATTYFTFCYPWSYTECQDQLAALDLKFKHLAKTHNPPLSTQSVYYHRELLCYSLQKLRVDLITISDHNAISEEEEPRFDDKLFPDTRSPRCKKFDSKRVYVLTSRVHPGESPASHVFNGFLEFILRENDPRAMKLRKQYVFKMIPLLNPDGVMLGHYRTDTRGVNLNRMYLDPDFSLHPSIYGAKSLLVYHHVHNKVVIKPKEEPISQDADKLTVNDTPNSESDPLVEQGDENWNLSHENGAELAAHRNRTFNVVYGEKSAVSEKVSDPTLSTSQSEHFHSDVLLKPLEFVPVIRETSSEMNATANKQETSVQHLTADFEQLGKGELGLNVNVATTDRCSEPMIKDSLIDDETEHLGNEGSEGEDDERDSAVSSSGTAKSPHLSDPKLLEIAPHESGIAFYVDLHGHASKRGCFIYGNNLEDEEKMIDCMLYPKLAALNTAHFDFHGCTFSIRNMYAKDKRDGMSKEGSGRVAIYKTIGIIHSYTLECNYNTGRMVNSIPPAYGDNGKATPPPLAGFPPKYTMNHYEDVGKALAIAALDMYEMNPWSRITLSEFNSIHTVREWVRRYLRGIRGGKMVRNVTTLKPFNGRSSFQANSNSNNASKPQFNRVTSSEPASLSNVATTSNRGNNRKPPFIPFANRNKELKPVKDSIPSNQKQVNQQKPRRRMTIPGCSPPNNKNSTTSMTTNNNTTPNTAQKSKTPPPVPFAITNLPSGLDKLFPNSCPMEKPTKHAFERGQNIPNLPYSRSDTLTKTDMKQALGLPTASGTDLLSLHNSPSYKMSHRPLRTQQLNASDNNEMFKHNSMMSTLTEENISPRNLATSTSTHSIEEEKVKQLKNISFLKPRQKAQMPMPTKPLDAPKKPELKMAAVRLHVEETGSDPPKRKSNKPLSTRRRSSSHSPKSAKGARKNSGTDSDAEKRRPRRRRLIKKLRKDLSSNSEVTDVPIELNKTLEGSAVQLHFSPRRTSITDDTDMAALQNVELDSPETISTELIDLQNPHNHQHQSGTKTPLFWVSW